MEIKHTLELGEKEIQTLEAAGKVIKSIREIISPTEGSDDMMTVELDEDGQALLGALKEALAFVK